MKKNQVKLTSVTVSKDGFYSNGCTKHIVSWLENGVAKRKRFRRSYSAQYFAKVLRYEAAGELLDEEAFGL